MHMSDALLSPSVGTAFWVLTLGSIGYASRKLKKAADEKAVPLMGVLGAFIFAAQMINFTIPGTGASGHLSGGMILAIVLGPYAGFLVLASVLTVQALFFADGGLLALGCNIWNLGIYPCFIAYPFIFRPAIRQSQNSKVLFLVTIVSALISLQLGAFSVVIQTALSGKSDLSLKTFILMMQSIHLVIGIIEGVVTAGIIRYVMHARPDIFEWISGPRAFNAGMSLKKILYAFVLLSVILGGFFSWFSSSNPDGLEWSVEKAHGNFSITKTGEEGNTIFRKIQEKTAFLPDYSFNPKKKPENSENVWPNADISAPLSGLIGSIIVICLIVMIGFAVRLVARKPKL